MTALVIGALQGATKQQLLDPSTNGGYYVPAGVPADYWIKNPVRDEVATIVTGSFRNRSPPEIRNGGYVVSALEAALWAFYHSTDYETGVLLAVNLGDDADTIAAIYGYLAGAYYGIGSIPTRWTSSVVMKPLFDGIADQLYSIVRVPSLLHPIRSLVRADFLYRAMQPAVMHLGSCNHIAGYPHS